MSSSMAKSLPATECRAIDSASSFSSCDSPQPQKHRRLSYELTEVQKPGFCCEYHRTMFADCFESDEERESRPVPKRVGKLTFLSEIPFDAKHHLVLTRDKRNAETQCEAPLVQSLRTLAQCTPTVTDDSEVRTVAARDYGLPRHLPEYRQPKLPSVALWNQFPEVPMCDSHPVECPYCSQRFSSGQALGGHTSRRHSSKRFPVRSKPLSIRPKRKRLLSIVEVSP